ncbi:peroxiredoxin [Marinicauda algicola]|uniref:Glutathione-dependent peroxiredoxin n=1 Tax=Marinicauda algicola TaxID=2029849 RepID=A0A4S2GW11_9PROT|nr:peroxiredoxin [Marinicauda algicola]TGY87194.1 peroxiredoxin [Marinicauda algicola]
MTIKVGDTLPDVTFTTMTADGPTRVTTDEVFGGRTVALFAVPGAFTPTCSARHLPGFIQKASELKAKGIDRIVCTAVNDAFVLGAWARDQGAGEEVMMLADGNADFAREIGLVIDASKFGMGIRSQRYSMVVEDKVVKHLFVEESGDFKVSSAEHMLAAL